MKLHIIKIHIDIYGYWGVYYLLNGGQWCGKGKSKEYK